MSFYNYYLFIIILLTYAFELTEYYHYLNTIGSKGPGPLKDGTILKYKIMQSQIYLAFDMQDSKCKNLFAIVSREIYVSFPERFSFVKHVTSH